jgi:hypothetical protein
MFQLGLKIAESLSGWLAQVSPETQASSPNSACIAGVVSLLANRSVNFQRCDRSSIRSENAVAVHEAAGTIEHPPQPHQAHATVTVADAVGAEVDSSAGLEVGARLEAGAGLEVDTGLEAGAEGQTWAQAVPGLHYKLEFGFRMTQGNTLPARLKSARAAPDL